MRISRTKTSALEKCKVEKELKSLGASYTHLKSLQGIVQPQTERVVAYHSMLESLEGVEVCTVLQHAYLGFNRLQKFRPQDRTIRVHVLDLAGNPLKSLHGAPAARELIVSGCLLRDLQGAPEGIEILRCGHSTHLLSLLGCPSSVKIIECSCSPNLVIQKEHLPQLLTDQTANV